MSSLIGTDWNIIVQNPEGGSGFAVKFEEGGIAKTHISMGQPCTYVESGNNFTLIIAESGAWPDAVTECIGSHENGTGSGLLTHVPKQAGVNGTFTMRKL